MGVKYAKGSRAWGECQRSGRRMLLKDMVADGYYPNLIVDPAWRDEPHPQEHLPAVQDPIALYRPAPMNLAPPTAPELTAVENDPDIELSWTASRTAASQIESYRIYRKIVDVAAGQDADYIDWVLLETITLVRNEFGAIEGPELEYIDEDVDLTAGTHHYYVEGVAVQGPPSEPSNVATFPQE